MPLNPNHPSTHAQSINQSVKLSMCTRSPLGRLPLTESNHGSRDRYTPAVPDTSRHMSILSAKPHQTSSVSEASVLSTLERYSRADTSYVTARPPLDQRYVSSRSPLPVDKGRRSSISVDLTATADLDDRSYSSQSG